MKAAATRKTNATKRSTAAKKAAGTRAANRGAAARTHDRSQDEGPAARGRTTAAKAAAEAKNEIRTPIAKRDGHRREGRLVPVGAALIARDEVVATFEDLRTSYGSKREGQAGAAQVRAPRLERRQGHRAGRQEDPHARRARAQASAAPASRRSSSASTRSSRASPSPSRRTSSSPARGSRTPTRPAAPAATKAATSVQERIAARV